jgi:hypothetical protein
MLMRTAALLGVVALVSGEAVADTTGDTLLIDLNSAAADVFDPPFSTQFTGELRLLDAGNTNLAGVLVNQAATGASGEIAFVEARLLLESGAVTGGQIVLVVKDDDDDMTTITADVTPGTGAVFGGVGSGFVVSTEIENGFVSRTTFAGIDAASWSVGEVCGNVTLFNLNPSGGIDNSADLDIELFGRTFTPAAAADLNVDGEVGAADLAILIGAWGPLP